MVIKAFLAAVFAAAITVGLVLPVPAHRAEARAQLALTEVAR